MEEKTIVDTRHCMERIKERAGYRNKRAQRQIDLARERGIHGENCERVMDRIFLYSQSDGKTEAVAYNGYCFIFSRENSACITMYKLPKQFGKRRNSRRITEEEFCFG